MTGSTWHVKAATCLLALSAMTAGCGKKDEGGQARDSLATSATSTEMLFNIDSIQQEIDNAIQFQRQELRADPDKINGYLRRLDFKDPVSIPLAIHFIEGYPEPPGASVYDTLYLRFESAYIETAALFDSIMNQEPYVSILNKQYDAPQDAQLKNLLSYFELYSVRPEEEEGGYVAASDPDLYFNVFGKKASPALHDFLVLRKKELAEGFQMDAGMLITFPQLYERIESWGKFLKDYHGQMLTKDAFGYYGMYLRTLLVGMDNTPAFENGLLSADVKKLYENIQQQGKDSVSRRIVSDYYQYLSKNGFKDDEKHYQFLDNYDLGEALGVETVDDDAQ